jgi:hypothetical protein
VKQRQREARDNPTRGGRCHEAYLTTAERDVLLRFRFADRFDLRNERVPFTREEALEEQRAGKNVTPAIVRKLVPRLLKRGLIEWDLRHRLTEAGREALSQENRCTR